MWWKGAHKVTRFTNPAQQSLVTSGTASCFPLLRMYMSGGVIGSADGQFHHYLHINLVVHKKYKKKEGQEDCVLVHVPYSNEI